MLIEIPSGELSVMKMRRSGRKTTEQLVCIMTGKKVSPHAGWRDVNKLSAVIYSARWIILDSIVTKLKHAVNFPKWNWMLRQVNATHCIINFCIKSTGYLIIISADITNSININNSITFLIISIANAPYYWFYIKFLNLYNDNFIK